MFIKIQNLCQATLAESLDLGLVSGQNPHSEGFSTQRGVKLTRRHRSRSGVKRQVNLDKKTKRKLNRRDTRQGLLKGDWTYRTPVKMTSYDVI